MKVSVCLGGGAATDAAWAADLQAALPGWAVSAWTDGDAPADYALVWAPPPAFWAAQPRLQAVLLPGAGADALLARQPPAGLPVYRLEDAGMGVQMAEYVLHAVLRWYRGFDRYATQAAAARWQRHEPERKADWPVGLLGAGVLAQPVQQALQALGFPVQAWARTAKPGVLSGESGLQQLLAETRVLVLLLPLTPSTERLLNAERLAQLRAGSYVINVARGGLVDESALLAALASGQLAGAALDVCAIEPTPPEHPFWRHPKIAFTPHVAAATLRDEAVAQLAGKLQALQRGEAVSGRVGDAGY